MHLTTTGDSVENAVEKAFPGTVCVDAKSLWDTCNTYGANRNRRCLMEMILIKQDLRQHQHSLRWIDTRWMLADCSTKVGLSGDNLRQAISDGVYRVRVEQEVLEAKKKKRTNNTQKVLDLAVKARHIRS